MRIKARRISVVLVALFGALIWVMINPASYEEIFTQVKNTGAENGIRDFDAEAVTVAHDGDKLATEILEKLEVKGRAPKKGYSREDWILDFFFDFGCLVSIFFVSLQIEPKQLLECRILITKEVYYDWDYPVQVNPVARHHEP